MRKFRAFIAKFCGRCCRACCIVVAAIVLVIDYSAGKEVQFPILYILPVGLAAWNNEKATAYALVVLLPLARVLFNFPWHTTETMPVALVNAVIRVISLGIYAYLLDRTASQTRELRKEIKVLEGILPVCSSCRKIRNEKGEYELIEKYIAAHSEVSFSHGLCDECAKKIYPEYFNSEMGQDAHTVEQTGK